MTKSIYDLYAICNHSGGYNSLQNHILRKHEYSSIHAYKKVHGRIQFYKQVNHICKLCGATFNFTKQEIVRHLKIVHIQD